jgi:hypothetical protein
MSAVQIPIRPTPGAKGMVHTLRRPCNDDRVRPVSLRRVVVRPTPRPRHGVPPSVRRRHDLVSLVASPAPSDRRPATLLVRGQGYGTPEVFPWHRSGTHVARLLLVPTQIHDRRPPARQDG